MTDNKLYATSLSQQPQFITCTYVIIYTREARKKNLTSKKIMSETKTIVLTVVRHGQTDANKKRLVQGEEIFWMDHTYLQP